MAKNYLEYEVFAEIIGRAPNPEHLNKIGICAGHGSGSYADCTEYVLPRRRCLREPAFQSKFGITEPLRRRWDSDGIDFRLHLYLKDSRVTGGHIYKYRTLPGGSGCETAPTQQEIRLARRILNYCTE